MKKGVIISSISCLILLGTVGAITAGKILINNKQETVTETSTYQSKEINHALATGDEVIGSWDVSKNGDGSVTATLYGDGKMVISGKGNMKDYSSSSNRPYDGNKTDIKIVEIQSGVTSIGSYAFDGCSSLTSIEIPSSVASIGYKAFYDCKSLTSIEIPSSVTSIGDSAFVNCSSLTNINVEKNNRKYSSEKGILFNKGKTEIICYPEGKKDILSYTIPNTVTSIVYYAFSGCSGLTSIEIPSSVTSIESYAFYRCSSLTSIEIPSSVASIGYQAFYDCKSLTSIEIPSSVTSIEDSAFVNCSSLTSITIPNSVTSIGRYAFNGCDSLTSIEISSSVTNIGGSAFRECSSLTSINVEKDNKKYSSEDGILFNKDKTEIICYPAGKKDTISYTIPNTVTSIGSEAFFSCKVLARIIIPNSVTSIGWYAFYGFSSFTIYCEANSVAEQYAQNNKINYTTESIDKDNIDIIGTWNVSATESDKVTAILYDDGKMIINGTGNMKRYSSSSDRPYDNKKTSIISVEIQSGVTNIGSYAFSRCSSLTSITIQNSVTSIGDYAFYDCKSLTSIEIPSSVTSIGDSAFVNCSSLTSITIPNSVTSIGDRAFEHCSSLTNIEIPSSVTSVGDFAFSRCSSLTSIGIPNSVTSIGDCAFSGCSSLTSINVEKDNKKYISENGILFNKDKTEIKCYPAGKKDMVLYTIPNTVTSIGRYAFNGCDSLTSIEISSSVTNIGGSAFRGCSSLESIKIPSSVTSVGYFAFSGCSSLASIEIPNSVTSIEQYAFEYCRSLTSIEIPSSVTSIGRYAFEYCESLTSIEIPSSVTSIGGDAFRRCTSLTNINVEKNNEMYSSEDGILLNKDKTEIICYPEGKKDIISYTIPNTVTSIGSKAFYNCEVLSRIIIPNSVTSIGSSAFDGCSSLTIYCKSNTKAEEYARENSKNYIIDDVAPIVNITGNPASWTKGNVTLTVNASDNLSGLSAKAYSFDNGTTWQAENTKTYTENTNGIVIKVKDNLDNIAIYETINITKIDKTAPTITSVTGNPTSWTKENVTLTVNASDNLSGLATKAYSFDNGTTWQAENTKTYTQNTNGIVIKVKDNADNITTYETINITKILLPESISIKTKPNKTTYCEGETLNTTGLVLIKKYNDGSQEEVTSEYTCTPTTLNTSGTQKITVTFAGKTTTFEVNVLKVIDTSEYKVENNNIKGTQSKTTLENFKKKITINGANTKILGKNNNELKNTDIVTTGTKIKTTVNNKEVLYTIIVTGDTNGDGQADLKDMLTINKHRLNKAQLTNEYLLAGDVNGDGKVDIKDLLQINKFRLGKINSL